MRGRKPKPAAEKRLLGNPGKRPIPDEPDFAAGESLTPPKKWSSRSHERREWDRLIPELVRCGVARSLHQGLLEKVCQLYAASERLYEKGDYQGVRMAVGEYRKLLAEFGATPTTASRVRGATAIGSVDRKEEDFFEEFFNGPKRVDD